MMIEDEELRSLYQATCRGRMQMLDAGLLNATSVPEADQLEALRREAHSLKGDSRVMGLEAIGTLAHHLEKVIKAVQAQTIEWRSPLTDRLAQTLTAIAQLIESATMGTTAEVDVQKIGEALQVAMVSVTVATSDLIQGPADDGPKSRDRTNLSASWIADADIRSLYATTSDRRLQSLRQALQQLAAQSAQAPTQLAQSAQASTILSTFRGEAQGLKSDSWEVKQGAIAAIAQQFEAIANRLMSASKGPLAPELEALLWQGLRHIEQLLSVAVNEKAADQPTPADSAQFLAALNTQVAQSLKTGKTGSNSAGDAGEAPLIATDLIEDTELRDIYKETSEGRLQRLETGLLQLVQAPEDGAVLRSLIREVHSLKGDAHSTGITPVATLAEAMETVLEQIQHRKTALTPELTQSFRESLMGMGALVQTATVGTVSNVQVAQLTQNLSMIADQAGPPEALPVEAQADSQMDGLLASESAAPEAAFTAVSAIEDEELRAVYRTVSTERLQRLESGLGQLASLPVDPDTISELLRETHSLKGDARSVNLSSVASLAHAIESLLVGFQNQFARAQTDQADALSTESADLLYRVLDAISQLIDEAITGLPIAMVNVEQLLQQLQEATLPAAATDSPDLRLADSDGQPQSGDQAAHTQTAPPVTASVIEDDELREVYRVASAERLQKLEIGLVTLEREPDNRETLAELLREAHSLKGDARSVGLDQVGSLAHAIESIFVGIQNKTVTLAGELSDLLYEGLDAIAQCTETAITGVPSTVKTDGKTEASATANIDPEQLLAQLREAAPTLTDASVQADLAAPPLTDGQSLTSDARPLAEESYRLETIRVQTRDLDTLAAQAEQLTLTRIQTAQATAKMTELLNLWGQWRTYRNTHPVSQTQPDEGINPYEGPLDTLMSQLRMATQENSFRLDLISQDLVQQVQTLRLLPMESVLRIFPRVVRDLARQQSKSVELIMEGGETTADKRILEEIQDSLMHLVRNALDHGIETPEEREAAGKPPTAKLWIRSYQSPNSIVIEVADDGRGLDLENIQQTAIRRKLHGSDELSGFSAEQIQDLIFVPGFSTRSFTTELSGRGVGLDVVRNQIERLKGNIQLESTPGKGCTFRLQISTQLATANVVFIKVRGITHALPIEFLQTTMRISRDEIVTVDGKDTIQWNERAIPITDLFDVLELGNSLAYQPPAEPVPDSQKACLLLKVGDEMGAFLVDRLLDTQEVIFKPQSSLLKRVRNVTGATILGNGEVCTILNPPDLIKSIQRKNEVVAFALPEAAQPRKSLILLVEDSPPVRIQEKRLFENAGYEVVTAENGLEGYKILREGNFDAVVSDIEMPELDGLSLATKIRQHQEYDELPIVLVTTLSSEEDRRKGADAGANAYIAKGKFNQEVLLETLHRLI